MSQEIVNNLRHSLTVWPVRQGIIVKRSLRLLHARTNTNIYVSTSTAYQQLRAAITPSESVTCDVYAWRCKHFRTPRRNTNEHTQRGVWFRPKYLQDSYRWAHFPNCNNSPAASEQNRRIPRKEISIAVLQKRTRALRSKLTPYIVCTAAVEWLMPRVSFHVSSNWLNTGESILYPTLETESSDSQEYLTFILDLKAITDTIGTGTLLT